MSTPQKTCFVISPIGDAGSLTRQRADQIFKYVIEPVLGDGWLIERADRITEPGIITNQIIDRLVTSDLVIADLSERNSNVFYELAVRHVARKPYVHLIAHDEDIPFDNAPVRAIKLDLTNLDSVDEARRDLEAQVKSALKDDAVIESPISVSISLSELRKSGDDEGVVLQSIIGEMGALRRQVLDLSHLVRDRHYAALNGKGALNALASFGLDAQTSVFDVNPNGAAATSSTSAALAATAAVERIAREAGNRTAHPASITSAAEQLIEAHRRQQAKKEKR